MKRAVLIIAILVFGPILIFSFAAAAINAGLDENLVFGASAFMALVLLFSVLALIVRGELRAAMALDETMEALGFEAKRAILGARKFSGTVNGVPLSGRYFSPRGVRPGHLLMRAYAEPSWRFAASWKEGSGNPFNGQRMKLVRDVPPGISPAFILSNEPEKAQRLLASPGMAEALRDAIGASETANGVYLAPEGSWLRLEVAHGETDVSRPVQALARLAERASSM